VSYINVDQRSLDEWHDDGGRLWEALRPLGVDLASVRQTDGSQRVVRRSREDEDDGYQPHREES
jgi:hypothetical protein